MGMHHTTNAGSLRSQADLDAQADREARIGDGTQLRPEDWEHLDYAERVQLRAVNPQRYQALATGQPLDGKWRPQPGRSTRSKLAQADL